MLIAFLSVCCWFQEAVGHTVITSPGLDTSYATSYDTQFDTYNDGLMYGDENYYYDEPMTTEVYAKPNTDQSNFGRRIKGTTYNHNSNRYQGVDMFRRVKVKPTKVIGHRNTEGDHTRKDNRVDQGNIGSVGHTGYMGMHFLGGAHANSEHGYYNTENVFRHKNSDYTVDYHPGFSYVTRDQKRGTNMEADVVTNVRAKSTSTMEADVRTNVRAKSTSTTPITVRFGEKLFEPTTLDGGNSQVPTTVLVEATATTQSPFVHDVTTSPANQMIRQESVQESASTASISQNAADPSERSSNRRFGIPISSTGIRYVRGLMLSALRRTQNT